MLPVWQNTIGLAGVIICPPALCGLAIAFVYWFLPKTKGLPVEEIIRVLEQQRRIAAPATTVDH